MTCGVCGADNTANLPFCAACGGLFKGPEAAAANTPDHGCRLARLGDRVTATILDGCFLSAIFLLALMASFKKTGGFAGNRFSPAAVGAALAAGTAYFWVCEALFGATLGKALAGIQVRAKGGGRCGFVASLVRNLLRVVDGLGAYLFGFIVALSSKSRQRLGDLAAGTIVVERKLSMGARAGLVILWLELFAASLIGAYLLHRGVPAPQDSAPVAPRAATAGAQEAITTQFLATAGGPQPNLPYKPGETVRLKYDIANFAKGADGRPSLLLDVLASDPKGLPLNRPWSDSFHAQLNPGMPIQGFFSVMLPAFAPPGTYKITVWARDHLNNREFQVDANFQVETAAVAPPQGLELRDFTLSLSPDGPPVAVPVVRGGSAVYMRGSLFGMRFHHDQVNDRIALKVVGPAGRVVFDSPNYAGIDADIIYHPSSFWLPLRGDLKLPAKLKKGTYIEQLTAIDNIARREVSTEAKFRVR